jgi:hypothetical protein
MHMGCCHAGEGCGRIGEGCGHAALLLTCCGCAPRTAGKTFVWQACPRAQQELAKPWVENTFKKLTGSIAAVAIACTVALARGW